MRRRVVAVVFFWYSHNIGTELYELWQFQYSLVHTESQLLYKRTVINYTCSLKWHYLSGAGEMSAKCLRNWANIV